MATAETPQVVVPAARPEPPAHVPVDFSIVEGGALHALFLRTRMARPSLGLLPRRIVVLTLVAWLPLLLLAMIAGRAWGGAGIPFLFDLDAHVRFLVSLPLLLYAETVVHRRMRPIVAQFIERNVVRPEERGRFDSIIASSMRLRNSPAIELLLAALVLTVGYALWRGQVALRSATWYAEPSAGRPGLTLPGAYFAFVSVPIYQFILLRWYFRVIIWCQFLWRVSRLDLRLIPTHPDRMAGLGFLQGSAFAFVPLLLAQSALAAGLLANRIFYEGATLPAFKLDLLVLVVLLLVEALGPLAVFTPRLLKCRRDGMREYGRLASGYVGAFEEKWLGRGPPPAEPLLGSADLQSLADLGNSFDVIREMNALPFGRPTVVRLAVAIALPLAPLALTMLPFDELLGRLLEILF